MVLSTGKVEEQSLQFVTHYTFPLKHYHLCIDVLLDQTFLFKLNLTMHFNLFMCNNV